MLGKGVHHHTYPTLQTPSALLRPLICIHYIKFLFVCFVFEAGLWGVALESTLELTLAL